MTIESDRGDIIELFGRYADTADTRSFEELPRLVHTDPFILDFASVTGMPQTRISLDTYIAAIRESFSRFVATHHAITCHVVTIDGDRAWARAHVRAEHWLPAATNSETPKRWLLVGRYENEVTRTAQGWRFSTVKLTAAYQENASIDMPAAR